MNIKKILLYFDNSLLFAEHSEHYTNLSTLNHNVRFLPVAPGRWHNAIRVRAKPCVHRFNYSRTHSPAEKFPIGGLWT